MNHGNASGKVRAGQMEDPIQLMAFPAYPAAFPFH